MQYKPKLCVNSDCNRTIYVPDYLLHMCLQCEGCVEKRKYTCEPAVLDGIE